MTLSYKINITHDGISYNYYKYRLKVMKSYKEDQFISVLIPHNCAVIMNNLLVNYSTLPGEEFL